MNKVICNLCGTSYPENATQCPICGEVRSTESSTENSGNSTYTYVKGGRFSKANVKKRNRASGAIAEPIALKEEKNIDSKKKNSVGLIILIIILSLAIVVVLGCIAVQLWAPEGFMDGIFKEISIHQNDPTLPSTNSTTPEPSSAPVETKPDLTCKEIVLNPTQIDFNEIGATVKFEVTLEPANTTDELLFSTSDASVATVSAEGSVTAISEGNAVITVTCGSVVVNCNVTCAVPSEPAQDEESFIFALNRKEITFNEEGQTWLLYDGEVALDEIIWTSDDNDIATIASGKVTAVSNGDTTVYGHYNGQTVSCIIHCDFDGSLESGGITEAGGTEKQVYKLYNPIGYADDVTIYVGDQFPLQLVDENDNEVTDAQWKSTDENICTYVDGIVEAVNVGTADVVATYEGIAYICTVRVIEE